MSPRVLAIIPARYQSSRFPGKPLADIAGKTLIQRTYENALLCDALDEVVVATDDARILDHVQGFGGHAFLTSENCPTGTDRAVEVLLNEARYADTEIVLNIQGDEPCVAPTTLQQVIQKLEADHALMSTVATPITDQAEMESPSIVKCVLSRQGQALYFSRSPLPGGKTATQVKQTPCYRHLGIYGFKRNFLLSYAQLESTPLQEAEDLEQLKVLEHGYRIEVAIVNEDAIGVDTPQDIKKVEAWLRTPNSSLSPAGSSPH